LSSAADDVYVTCGFGRADIVGNDAATDSSDNSYASS
jgi:hypothetical protein